MIIVYLPPVLFTIFFFGMCLFYYDTYLSMQERYIQIGFSCIPILLIISAIQLIRFGPGYIDQNTKDKLDLELIGALQEELKSLMENEEKLLEILEQNELQTETLSEEKLIHLVNLKIQEQKGIRICKSCEYYKPQRTHHCSQCKRCVQRMDHHCLWLNSCIGMKNYKYFMNLIFYVNFCLILVSFTYFRTYINSVHDTDTNLLLKFTFYHGTLLLASLFLPFFFHHLRFYDQIYNRLAMNNQTTIEFYEKRLKVNPYYINVWQNLKEMWGSEWYFWLLPI